MVSFRLAALAPIALMGMVSAATDNAEAVYQSITNINNAVLNLTSALNNYNGGILQTQPVFDASIVIHYVNRQGFTAASTSSNFSQAESKRIVDHVNDSVGNTIPAAATLIEAKKPLFDAANVSSLVESTIVLLKTDHETFSLAVGAHLTPDQVPGGLIAAGKIDASLEAATAYYLL